MIQELDVKKEVLIPLIDSNVPANIEMATFALG